MSVLHFMGDVIPRKSSWPTACSRALATADFFLFSTVQNALKGSKFQAVDGVRKKVTTELNAVTFGCL
jgi:hypothetical protein